MTDNEGREQEKKGEKPEQPINNGMQPVLAQADSKNEKEKFEVSKRKVEIEILEIKKKKLKCFSYSLSTLVWVFSLTLIGGGILVFCSIKEGWENTYNWIRLIFGSLMMVSFVVLIIAFCRLLKKLVSPSDEE
jgi:hypothetical protein